jgi:prepilin-type N-terminal cleavage/methylation domain-containing protein
MAIKNNGVTLVELIIVVLIIGVMAFVAVPRMELSTITAGKAQAAAQKITTAIRYTRSLAIANAAINTQGFSLNMTGSDSYTGYQIVNLNTNQVVETGSIGQNVSCTGANDFRFGPLGNRLQDTDSLTVGAGGKIFSITVISATGMIRCEQQ